MEAIKISVTGNEAAVTNLVPITGGMVGLPVVFSFDESWEGLEKTAVFRCGNVTLDRLYLENQTTIPWELTKKTGCHLWAGVYGCNGDGSVQIPTVWVDLGEVLPGADPSGDESADPSLPVWKQAMQNLRGSGSPTTVTPGMVGGLYMDTDTGTMYKCTAEKDGIYTWLELVGSSVATDEKYFDIDYDGIVSLKAEYRGHPEKDTYPYAVSDNGVGVDGSKIAELPEKIVIPNVIDGTAVSGFRPGMFYGNESVKEITIPETVEEIPEYFCREAINLKTVNGTQNIKKVGNACFGYTRVGKLLFPNLKEMASGAFGACSYLYSIDICDHITEISEQAFQQCMWLSLVKGGSKVTKIGNKAFWLTSNLKNLPFLSQVTYIGDGGFYKSRIQFDWDSIKGQCTFGTGTPDAMPATPVIDNTTDFWTGVTTEPCENRIVSRLSQKDTRWNNNLYGDTGEKYRNGCAVFATLHIHSALTGKVYNHPDEFAEEVRSLSTDDENWVDYDHHPMFLNRAVEIFQKFGQKWGYQVTAYYDVGTAITKERYQQICDALARGAYVYAHATAEGNINSGHAVVLYGINSNGEMLVLDSSMMFEKYRATGITDDVYVYRMPYQNLVGPVSGCIIVEKNS